MQRRSLLIAAALALATPAYAAAQGKVVTSFSILADLARQVAPPGVEVVSLVGPDSDAHGFRPSPSHGRQLASADLVIVNGLGFEGWLDRLIKASGYRGPVVVASAGVSPRRAATDAHGHDHGGVDPHAWQDPARVRVYVQNIAAAMAQRWPAERAAIEARRDAYLAKLAALETRLRAELERVPRAERRVITSHDAFGYLGEAFGVDFLTAQGWNPEAQASAAATARLIRQIREQKVRAIFVENISDPRLMERIAREGGARVGGVLYSDALSGAQGPAPDYLDFMAHNVRSIAAALTTPR